MALALAEISKNGLIFCINNANAIAKSLVWTDPKNSIRPPGAQGLLQRKQLVVGVYNNTVNELNAKKYTRCKWVVFVVTELIVGKIRFNFNYNFITSEQIIPISDLVRLVCCHVHT